MNCDLPFANADRHKANYSVDIVHWPLVGRRPRVAATCRPQVCLSCDVLYQIVSIPCLSTSSNRRLAGIHCRLFLWRGLQVLTNELFEAVDVPMPRTT